MKYIVDNCSVELSVRELCERAFCGGDIDKRARISKEALRLGAQTHKKIQAEGGINYSAEVTLTNTCVYDGIYYTVSGRADGVIKKDGKITVDEIKSVKPFEFSLPPKEIFLAQLKCYAYFLACREDISLIRGRLTYVNSENEKI